MSGAARGGASAWALGWQLAVPPAAVLGGVSWPGQRSASCVPRVWTLHWAKTPPSHSRTSCPAWLQSAPRALAVAEGAALLSELGLTRHPDPGPTAWPHLLGQQGQALSQAVQADDGEGVVVPGRQDGVGPGRRAGPGQRWLSPSPPGVRLSDGQSPPRMCCPAGPLDAARRAARPGEGEAPRRDMGGAAAGGWQPWRPGAGSHPQSLRPCHARWVGTVPGVPVPMWGIRSLGIWPKSPHREPLCPLLLSGAV